MRIRATRVLQGGSVIIQLPEEQLYPLMNLKGQHFQASVPSVETQENHLPLASSNEPGEVHTKQDSPSLSPDGCNAMHKGKSKLFSWMLLASKWRLR